MIYAYWYLLPGLVMSVSFHGVGLYNTYKMGMLNRSTLSLTNLAAWVFSILLTIIAWPYVLYQAVAYKRAQ